MLLGEFTLRFELELLLKCKFRIIYKMGVFERIEFHLSIPSRVEMRVIAQSNVLKWFASNDQTIRHCKLLLR